MKNLCYSLALFLAMALFFPATAQVRYGVKGGVNIAGVELSNPDLLRDFHVENITGFQLGATMEALIPGIHIGGDVALLYSQRGFKLRNKIDGENANARTGYLEVPLNLKWKPTVGTVKLFVTAGPYIALKVSQNITLKELEGVDNNIVKPTVFSSGFNFGLGIEVFKHLQIGANYALGLTDDYKSARSIPYNLSNPKSKTWSITAAYYF